MTELNERYYMVFDCGKRFYWNRDVTNETKLSNAVTVSVPFIW